MLSKKTIVIGLILLLVITDLTECRRKKLKSKLKYSKTNKNKLQKIHKQKSEKQLFYETRETNPPNFVRLVLMRLIYGIATNMGLEDRLAGVFNGAFVPPNADEDFDIFGDGFDDAGIDFGGF